MTRQLQLGGSKPICRGVILSRLLAMFITFSLLLGPLAMDRAMAATPAQSHSQMSDDTAAKVGHCQPADQDMTHKATSKPCCAAMCATAAVVPQASASEHLFDRLLAIPAPASIHRGVLSEIATPPPRAA